MLVTMCSASAHALEVTKDVCTGILTELGLPTTPYKFKDGWVTNKHIFNGSVECYDKKGHVFISSDGEVYAEFGFFGKSAVAARNAVLSLHAKEKSELKVTLDQQIEEARRVHKTSVAELTVKMQKQLNEIRQNEIPDSIAAAVAQEISKKEADNIARQERAKKKSEERAKKIADKKAEKERKTAERTAKKESEEATEKAIQAIRKKNGYHCLSGWDGSHPQVVKAVKSALNDPGSFDHQETKVISSKNGEHQFQMIYRAKNGFGALVLSKITGSYSNSDCAVTEITQE